jgi:uncharacterized protein (TIGR03032 family)
MDSPSAPINAPEPDSPQSSFSISTSAGLWDWLTETNSSIAFTTYQTNRLFMVGRNSERRIAVNERLFDKPMGLYADSDRLVMSTRYQIWQLENRLAPNEDYQGSDRLYFPTTAHTTGDLNVHDVVIDHQQNLLFINTDFSCLARLRSGYSFEPIWTPPFITKLAAEDRCHLNGLAMIDSKPAYATACSATNEAAGWRHHRVDGGIVMHIPSNEIVTTGLSMPHSPRWYQGKLWLLNAGTGELGYLDNDKFIAITFCPGFVRGLAFCGNFALVGMSKLRSTSFGGLELEKRLAATGQTSQCGLVIIDITNGQIINWLQMTGTVEELFDVVVLPNTIRPQAIGLQAENIDRLVNFPGSNGLITTKPTVKRPGVGATPPIAGVPRPSPSQSATPVKYQRVYHLNASNLLPYDALTFPSLQQRWQSQPPRGELIAVSASVAGEMIGLAVAEALPNATAELISLFVLPLYRQQGVGATLVEHLKRDAPIS